MRGSFNDPVYVQNGRTLVEEICSAEQAIDFMERKRLEAEDLVARVTWQALNKCLAGEMPVNAARETFFRMAKKKGLLAEPEMSLSSVGRLAK